MRFQRTAPINGGDPTHEEEKRGPGETSHGAYQAVRLYKERPLDLRRADHRFLSEWKKSLIDDLGGPGEISVLQAALTDQCVSLLIILSAMASYVEENGIVGKDGELVGCLKQSFISYQNSLRLHLAQVYDYGNGRKGKGKKSKKPLDLESYLKSKEGQNEKASEFGEEV
jgi:hypothetical protein